MDLSLNLSNLLKSSSVLNTQTTAYRICVSSLIGYFHDIMNKLLLSVVCLEAPLKGENIHLSPTLYSESLHLHPAARQGGVPVPHHFFIVYFLFPQTLCGTCSFLLPSVRRPWWAVTAAYGSQTMALKDDWTSKDLVFGDLVEFWGYLVNWLACWFEIWSLCSREEASKAL